VFVSNILNGYGGSGGYYVGGSSSSSSSSSAILDRGGVFLSTILPSGFTSVVEDSGNSLKSDLPAPVAKTLPNTGGGWVTLALAGGALYFIGRFLIRRFASR
jgi:hypothetical protein